MNETLLTEGRFIRNAFLPQRRRVAIENLTSNSEHDKEVELVSRDTAYPEGNIYDEVIVDSQKGKQHLRVVRTTKPYNPDFTVSAQTLTFILPDADYSRRIVTPQEGDRESWKRFMEINKTSAEVMVNYYKEQGMENFLVLIGGSFNPYTDKNVLRTQSVKTAHVHTLLISDAYLQEAVQFHSSLDFRKFLSQGVRTPDEIRMDYRRFFHSHINDYFNLIVSRTFLDCLNRKKYSDFTMNNLEEPNTRFPLNGIRFTTDGLDFLSSSDFVDMIKTTGEEIEKIYKEEIMPIFVRNYEEAINSPNPEEVQLKYNPVDTAISIFGEKVKALERLGLTTKEIHKIKRLVRKLALRLSNNKDPKFNLGPAYSFSVLYDKTTNKSEIFISYSPFGSGTFDAIGLDKVWFPNEPKDYIQKRFNNPKSAFIEEDFFKRIQKELS
ncbi:MAG: hypothetical protein COU25_00975 [Candidatus Levybacteria bacterium CG10_big_fil_rev_8_21_14_0_10_35_13]|nr:MAG: hypothetical protein COU25_00975 [Candidatus Levybacteria bacterium CG10_big_fil_rev_8_21_14_0_10_35_13]